MKRLGNYKNVKTKKPHEKRAKFSKLFKIGKYGIRPRKMTRIGGLQIGPKVRFGEGVTFGGVRLADYTHRDLQYIERDDGLVIVTGVYK